VCSSDLDQAASAAAHPNALNNFYTDPVKNPLGTPTGKIELFSQNLADKFPDDNERGPMAKWVVGGPESQGWTHDERLGGARAQKYPLLIVSNHPRWRHHAQMEDATWLKEIPTAKIRGFDGYLYEPLWINPADAAKRNIKNGDIVKIYNERGIVLGGAYVTHRIMPGAVYQDHGARVDAIATGPDEWIDRGGANNLISPYQGVSKNCHGMATSGFLVEVQNVTGKEWETWRNKYPEAFARRYDPGSGLCADAWVEGGL